MIPVYNKNNYSDIKYLTKSQADTAYIQKTKDDTMTGTLTVLNDLQLGNNMNVSGGLNILGDTNIGDEITDKINLKGETKFTLIPKLINTNTETYTDTQEDNYKLTTKKFIDDIFKKQVNISTSHSGHYYDLSGNHKPPLVMTDYDTTQNKYANISFIINGSDGNSQIVSANNSIDTSSLKLSTYSSSNNGITINNNSVKLEAVNNNLIVNSNGISMTTNPKINSYILPNNDLELIPKKYVDDSISNKKTFITSNGKGATQGIDINDSISSKGVIVVPNASQGNYNPSVLDGSTSIISRSNVIDTSSLCIAPHSNTNTGIQLSTNSINIGCGGLGLVANTNINMSNNTIQFSKVPILSSDLTSSITTDNHFTNKKYVDDKIVNILSTVSESITYEDKAFHFEYFNTTNTKYYGLYYPYTGARGITGGNSEGWYRNFFVNTKKNLLNCTIDLFSWQRINNIAVIGGATTRGGENGLLSNINVRQSPPFDPSIYIAGGNNTYFPISSTIVFSFLSGGFYATVIQSNKVGWKNASQVPQVFQSQYSPTSGITRLLNYNGLVFQYQGANTVNNPTSYNRIFCSVGFGNIINSPSANAGSCSEYGYTAKVINNYDASGNNGCFITQLETSPPQTMDTTGW